MVTRSYNLALSSIPHEKISLCCIFFRYALVLIAMFNAWDLIGRYVPIIFKLKSRKCIMAATLARFLLIPAFYFTAKHGAQGYMIILTSFLGLSNGYLTVCVLTEAPKGYNVSFPLLYIFHGINCSDFRKPLTI